MKIGVHASLALAVMALSSTVSWAAPTAPAPPTVGGKPVEKGGVVGPHKTLNIRCPATTDDGSGLPALEITPIDLPATWRAGSSVAIRLMSATVADGKVTCAYGALTGAPVMRTTKVIPAGATSCTPQPDKTITCTY